MTGLKFIINEVNTAGVGTIIKRKDMMRNADLNNISHSRVDNLRNMLVKSEFIE